MGKPARGRMRRALRVFLAAGALLTGAVLVLGYSGRPQQWATEWAVERSFGVLADVEWGGTVPELWIKSIRLYPSAEARQKKQPLAAGFNVRTQYQFLGGRKIKGVRIGVLMIDLDLDDPALEDLPFPETSSESTSTPADATFLPRAIVIDAAAVRIHRADGAILLADSAAIEVDLTQPEAVAFTLRGQAGIFALDAGDAHARLNDIALEGTGRYEHDTLRWSQTVENPGVFRLAFDVEGPLSGEDPHADVTIREASLQGEGVPAFLESIAAPLRFAEFRVETAKARVALGDETALSLSASARVYKPRLPAAAEPLYDGVIELALSLDQTATLDAAATLAFQEGQRAIASLRGDAETGEAQASIAGWSREQFLDAMPPAFRESFSGLGFDTFSSETKVDWTSEAFTLECRAESSGDAAGAAPIFWSMQAQGPRDGGHGIEGTAEARLGDRRVRASARYESADHYVAEATIEQVQIAPWVELLAGEAAASPIAGTIEGLVRAEAKGKDAPLEIRPEIILKNFEYDTLKLDEITAKGTVQYSSADGRTAIGEFRIEAPDGMTSAILTGWDYDTTTESGGGAFALSADLNVLGHLMNMPDLIGSGAIEGKATLEGAQVNADFGIASGDFGYGALRSPYGTKLNGAGTLKYDREKRRGELRDLKATIGDGTTISFGATPFATSPASAEGEVTLTSDLQILVLMEWLDNEEGKESQGALNGTASFRLVDDSLHADWKFDMSAPKFFLAKDAGSAETVEFDGAGTYDGALSGTGNVRAARLTAAGGSISNVAGPVLFDGDQMRIQAAKGELFRGSVRADIDVGVLTQDFPILLNGSFEDADLAILTDEVKPPKTELTGTARGTISVEYDMKGLHAFTFEAQAPTGLSVNRSLVEELLQSDTFLSGAGANVAEKTMDKLLGSAPQRPFDRGSINVQLANEKITGLAVLESEKTKDYNGLNLRVTLDMDQSTLAEALKMLQEASAVGIDP